jgi:hypothetical protein
MSDNPHDETQPVRPAGTPPTPPTPPQPPQPQPDPAAYAEPAAAGSAPRRGFRDRFRRIGRGGDTGGRAFGLGALVASTLAGVVVGGLGGVLVHAATDEGDRGWDQRHEVGSGRFGDRDEDGDHGVPGGPGSGFPGAPPGLPPSTAPDDDDSDS